MQRQFRRNIIFPFYRKLCHLTSTITTQVMQTYVDSQLQLQSSCLLSVVMLERFFLIRQLFSHRVTPPPCILVVGLCILILRQFIPNMFRILSIILIPVVSQSTKTAQPSSAYPNQGCSSDRPLSARELAELLMHRRKDHLPE